MIVVPNDSKLTIASPDELITKAQKIAIRSARSAGRHLHEKYLSSLGLWEKLESKMVPTENVRAALAAVESGMWMPVSFTRRTRIFRKE